MSEKAEAVRLKWSCSVVDKWITSSLSRGRMLRVARWATEWVTIADDCDGQRAIATEIIGDGWARPSRCDCHWTIAIAMDDDG